MSFLVSSKPIKLDFSKGFTFFTSIKIRPQKHEGRKVVFQIAHIKPLLKITLGLDNKNDIALWLDDTHGHSFKAISVKKNKFFQKSVYIHFSVIPGKDTGEKPKLELGVNDYYKQTEIDSNLGSEEDVIYSIGGNLNGKENAAFDMAALSLYNIVLSHFQIQQVSNSLTKEFGGKDV